MASITHRNGPAEPNETEANSEHDHILPLLLETLNNGGSIVLVDEPSTAEHGYWPV